eukprot:TRINITY_DN483_c0_g1_i9.p2 TRINITY_DN483_c0_g1~~TRINITY_DN483_c0_g1_i9.p2  ORF type:complete len:164 (+),score=47.85 TRINITY_DN483_c0_g1_i9:237-728(+)
MCAQVIILTANNMAAAASSAWDTACTAAALELDPEPCKVLNIVAFNLALLDRRIIELRDGLIPEINKINQRLDDLEQDAFRLRSQAQPLIEPAPAPVGCKRRKTKKPPATLDLEQDLVEAQVLQAQMQPSCKDELDEMYESDDSLETQECLSLIHISEPTRPY